MRSVSILGVRVDDVTFDEAIALIERYVDERGPHAIVTPNPELVMLARRRPDFAAALASAALAVPDGVGLLLAARWLGSPLREHVRGTDLVGQLARRSVERGWRWLLLGAADGVATEAGRRLGADYPGLCVAGAFPGSPRPEDDQWVRQQVRAVGEVDIALVAYGAPAQELWLQRNLGPLDLPVGIGVGGVLNFLAGRVPRAPAWIRRLELEFLYRLWTEPWRWRRQLTLPRFAALAARQALTVRLAQPRQRDV